MTPRLYEQGHIAGAVGWNWQSQLQQSIRMDALRQPEVERLLGAAGISNNTTVILYGDWEHSTPTASTTNRFCLFICLMEVIGGRLRAN